MGALHLRNDFTDARSGESWKIGQIMEYKWCMFGSTSEDEKDWVCDLFAFCVSQILTLAACNTEYDHRLSINDLGLHIMEQYSNVSLKKSVLMISMRFTVCNNGSRQHCTHGY